MVISRESARAVAQKYYFTGDPCKHGHIANRLVGCGVCCECIRVARQTSRINNGDAVRAADRLRYTKDRTKIRARQELYRTQNLDKEKMREYHARYYLENTQKFSDAATKWRLMNPGKKAAHHQMRRSRKRNAVPSWFGEFDEFVWAEASDLVRRRRASNGIAWAADHIIPLAARMACGLHAASNCQVIPAVLNNKKHTRMWLTEPFEWLRHL